ncbi:MAG: two-component system, OmpR family, sensor kinase [Chloroflexota bacterium]|nr:two-component system, OmpR family, sensor kinase [Chloroflexota bacterium]
MTIRTRLALAYGAAVGLTIVVVGLVVWWQFGLVLRASVEQLLEERVVAVANSLENEEQPGLQESDADGDLFVLLVADGAVIDASANAPTQVPTDLPGGTVREVVLGGRSYLLEATRAQRGVKVVAGADLAPLARSQASLAGLLAVAAVVSALVSAFGGWWLAGRALRPVADITAEAAAIGASDLSRRLPEPTRLDELGVLARTLNGMLDRIGDVVKRQRAFVAAASHDLRTPLAALQTELELADMTNASADELLAAVRAARDDATRLGELAADLLQLATVSSEGRELIRADVDLADLVESVLRRVSPVAERSGVRILNSVEHHVAQLDRIRVEQALTNVLINAVTYSAPGGVVEITVARDGDGTAGFALEVLDRGPGVDQTDRETIFEAFHRGASARGSGAGLGLATARAAVEAHGGSVTVEDRPGGGASFQMRFPNARR